MRSSQATKAVKIRGVSRPRGTRPTVSVIVSMLNETASIGRAVGSMPAMVGEVIVVDGRSTDGTLILRAIAAETRYDHEPVADRTIGRVAMQAAVA